jgi:hypothetical protein
MSSPPSNILTPSNAAVVPEPTKVLSKGKTSSLSRFMNTLSKKQGPVRAISLVRDILFRAPTASSGDLLTESFDYTEDKRAVRFAEDPSTHYMLSHDDNTDHGFPSCDVNEQPVKKQNWKNLASGNHLPPC